MYRPDNDSLQHIEQYTHYNECGDDLTDVDFEINDEVIKINQPIDDEEPDKYLVFKKDVTLQQWNDFVELINHIQAL
jgi:hypothetical protein